MMHNFIHLAGEIFNRPHFVHPDRAQMILWSLRQRLGVEIEKPAREAAAFFGRPARSGMYRVENGAAIIPIIGTLVNRGGWIGANSGLVAYEGLAAQLREAVEDVDVDRIVLDIDSPGGMVAGAFQLAEQIKQARAVKPVTAVVNDMAASAAYLLAAQANEIVISPTSMVGSIGVIYIHSDYSEALKAEGVRVTIITAGERKADGNPYEPLPDEVKDDIQRSVDLAWDLFIEAVHSGRPSLSPIGLRNMEARIFEGRPAINSGLADRIGTIEEVLGISRAQGAQESGGLRAATRSEEVNMTDETTAPEAKGANDDNGQAAADVTAIRAEGAQAERERIAGILELEEAKGREALARKLALTTDLSPDQAKEILAASPEAKAGDKAASRFEDAGIGLELAAPLDRKGTAPVLSTAQIYKARREALAN